MRSLILTCFITGCASKGFRYPGPLGGLGSEPPPYADRVVPVDAPAEEAVARSPRKKRRSTQGESVAEAAGKMVGKSRLVVDGERFRFDCSGMVTAAYTDAGLDLSGNTASLYAQAKKNGTLHKRKIPDVGDLVFFDNTWDRNGNGRRDDKLTHVAVVETVDGAGTQTLVHLGSKGIVRIQMNLKHPGTNKNESGETINSYLRRGSSGARLSGELWIGFSSMWEMTPGDGLSLGGCVQPEVWSSAS